MYFVTVTTCFHPQSTSLHLCTTALPWQDCPDQLLATWNPACKLWDEISTVLRPGACSCCCLARHDHQSSGRQEFC